MNRHERRKLEAIQRGSPGSVERMQEIADAVCEVFNNFGVSSDEIASVCVNMLIMAVDHIDCLHDREQMAKAIADEIVRAGESRSLGTSTKQ
jgi:hypothetical protein